MKVAKLLLNIITVIVRKITENVGDKIIYFGEKGVLRMCGSQTSGPEYDHNTHWNI